MKKILVVYFVFLTFFSGQNYIYAATTPKKGVGETVQPRGLEYCGSNPTCLQNYWNKIKELGISWIYNWDRAEWDGSGRPGWMTGTTIEYVPMIGGGGSEQPRVYTVEELSKFARYAGEHPGSSFLLWNEPDIWSPASIAASAYSSIRNVIKTADPTAKLIVGNVTYEGRWWLNSFREEYKKIHGLYPVVEGWAGHLYKDPWQYNNSTSTQKWRDDLNNYHNWMISIGDGSKEFWLTEFGCLSSNSVGMQIMNDQLSWLEEPAQLWITRYAWFQAGLYYDSQYKVNWPGNLFENSIKDMTVDFSNLGVRYASAPGPGPVFYQCPSYEQNCVLHGAACPSGKTYDRLGECGLEYRCCNPYITATPTVTPTLCPRGDLGNLDCTPTGEIDASDMDILLESWGSPVPTVVPGFPSVNLDGQNGIDASDFDILLSNWGS